MFKRRIFSFGVFAALLLSIVSCPNLPTSSAEASLSGYWISAFGDGFSISDSNVYTQYDNAAKDVSFAGDIVKKSDENLVDSEGYIVIEITNAGTWGKTVGKFHVIRWKELTDNKCKQACAAKFVGTNDPANDTEAVRETIELAETELTESDGYFGHYGDYERR
ncbi:MAG TPA: hypothetical protein PK385_10675 [Spirochaetota bacterium]|nr:hypothetical protein [Spirochaetota bacterium]HOS33333.1 hypothetical protein [Spirochaetota bacterium]HOS56510.1 hypothetical protein [Spirochaetota bacterium]HPK62020.1 hypothetical protein [Spirochaetota bacterium]HQF77053.1 hypothetical protein [Spirochaetota bacterium]